MWIQYESILLIFKKSKDLFICRSVTHFWEIIKRFRQELGILVYSARQDRSRRVRDQAANYLGPCKLGCLNLWAAWRKRPSNASLSSSSFVKWTHFSSQSQCYGAFSLQVVARHAGLWNPTYSFEAFLKYSLSLTQVFRWIISSR